MMVFMCQMANLGIWQTFKTETMVLLTCSQSLCITINGLLPISRRILVKLWPTTIVAASDNASDRNTKFKRSSAETNNNLRYECYLQNANKQAEWMVRIDHTKIQNTQHKYYCDWMVLDAAAIAVVVVGAASVLQWQWIVCAIQFLIVC